MTSEEWTEIVILCIHLQRCQLIFIIITIKNVVITKTTVMAIINAFHFKEHNIF